MFRNNVVQISNLNQPIGKTFLQRSVMTIYDSDPRGRGESEHFDSEASGRLSRLGLAKTGRSLKRYNSSPSCLTNNIAINSINHFSKFWRFSFYIFNSGIVNILPFLSLNKFKINFCSDSKMIC